MKLSNHELFCIHGGRGFIHAIGSAIARMIRFIHVKYLMLKLFVD